MLVLTRNINQTVMIGDTIQVRVLSLQGGQVRLGIQAPRNVPVHRQEVYERIRHTAPTQDRTETPALGDNAQAA